MTPVETTALDAFSWVHLWLLVLGCPLTVLALDFAYSRLIGHRRRRWESGRAAGPGRVFAGCEDFAEGTGGTALLMVHGFGDSPALFRRLAPLLAAKGFACRAARLPGFGVPAMDSADASYEQWMEVIAGEVAVLRRDHAAVWIVGHSLGCSLAVEHAAAFPKAVDGLVLLAPLVEISNRRSPLFLPARTWFNIGERALRFTRVLENVYPVDLHDRANAAFLEGNRFVHFNIYRQTFRAVDGVWACARRLQGPLLMVVSRFDRVVSSRSSEAFFRNCSASPKQLVWADRAGHVIPLDAGWEDVGERIAWFVRRGAALEGGGSVVLEEIRV